MAALKPVTLQVTRERVVDHRGRNSRRPQQVKLVTYDVRVDGALVGQVLREMVTRETRSAGRVYVNSRWESPGWRNQLDYRWAGKHGLQGRRYHGLDYYTRKAALEDLLHTALGTDWGTAEAMAEAATVVRP